MCCDDIGYECILNEIFWKKNGCIKGLLLCLLVFDKIRLVIYFGLIFFFIGCKGGGFSIKMMEFV